MAARFANKIHSLVNNVVLRTPSIVPRKVQPIMTAGLKVQIQNVELAHDFNTLKPRYPLNQQDANSYIKGLKGKGGACNDTGIVRTFNVLLHARPNAKARASMDVSYVNGRRTFACAAGGGKKKKSKKICKEPSIIKKRKEEEIPKMEDDERCPKFQSTHCDTAKSFICRRRPYYFAKCNKRPAPHASFSESCYEGPFPTVHECKDCPWEGTKHPTYKRPKDKFGPPGRKFHTDARRWTPFREEEETQDQALDNLNKVIFQGRAPRAKPNVTLSEPPRSLVTDLHQEIFYLKQAAQQIAPVDAQRIEMLFAGKGPDSPRHKIGGKKVQRSNRPKKPPGECDQVPCSKMPFTPTPVYDIKEKLREIEEEKERKGGNKSCTCMGLVEAPSAMAKSPEGMLCKMVPKKPTNPNDMTCDKLAPSPVCPKDLLDRKPYPKYRKAMKKRLKKEKEIERKRQAKKAGREAEKPKPEKTCAARIEGGPLETQETLWFDVDGQRGALLEIQQRAVRPVPTGQEVTFMAEMKEGSVVHEGNTQNIGNVILAKDRIRVKKRKNPPECNSGHVTKKKCGKPKIPLVCPKDLLDRKPFKKYRNRKCPPEKKKKRCPKGKGKKAAGIGEEGISVMLMEAESARASQSSRLAMQ